MARIKTDMSEEDLHRWLNQTQEDIQHFRVALGEAEDILDALHREYLKDEGCDGVKINKLISRGGQFVSIRRAR